MARAAARGQIAAGEDDPRTPAETGWWLRLTAPPDTSTYDRAPTREERERLRRAGLISVVAPGVAILPFLLIAQARVDLATEGAILLNVCFVALALALNRFGQQTAAAVLLVLGTDALIEGSVLAGARAGGLSTGWLLTFDLFAAPLVLSALVLPRRYLWFFASLHVVLVLGDFYLLPHAPDLVQLIRAWNGDTIAYARPILLQIVVTVIVFVMARSSDQAITRADRAEQMAAFEHEAAEQKRRLDIDVQELLATHVRAANGDFSARAPMNQGSALWQVSASLNNLLGRLQKTGQSDFQLKRTEQEIDRLAEALLQARAGRRPIWPAPTGTQVDRLLEVLLGGQRQPVAPPTGQFSAQMGQSSAPRLPGNAGGQPGWENPWQSAPPQGGGAAPFDIDGGGQWGGSGPLRGFGEE